MKLLLVTGLFPPDHGGPASYVPAIAKGLLQQGHEIVAIVTLSDCVDHNDRHYGFPVVRLKRTRPRFLRMAQTIGVIARLARQADVVYLNGLVLEGIVAAKLIMRRPVVIKVVGDLIWEKARNSGAYRCNLDDFQSQSLSLPWRFLRWLQGRYTALADAVITPSHYLAKIVAGWGVDIARIRVIYNAVTHPPEFPVGANSVRYDIVTVARLVPWKGLRELIEVVSDLGLSLRIVGDGPMRDDLEAFARRRAAKVSFAGHVIHDLILNEIRSARLFVLNSSYEGLPHVVLEAKAAGVAVLATSAGGTPEIIEHGVDGWLIPVQDKAALAEGIRYLLSDEAVRERLAEAGRRQVTEKFSFKTQVEATAAGLAEVCRSAVSASTYST